LVSDNFDADLVIEIVQKENFAKKNAAGNEIKIPAGT
jgi:hypothetical protein